MVVGGADEEEEAEAEEVVSEVRSLFLGGIGGG